MKIKKILAALGIISLPLMMAGCNNMTPEVIEKETVEVNVSSDSLFVKKVDNMPDDFIKGMDVSSVISLEQAGVKFYDHDGNEKDLLKILAENGINYIRVRVWNDPYDENGKGYGGGNSDLEKCIEIGKRATKYGMKLLVNFHYSDFWADPAKQEAPKAWKDLSVDQKVSKVHDYTRDALKQIYLAGIDVGMVQIGNETNDHFCGESTWENMCKLFNAGSKAVREVLPNALVALHFANPEKENRYTSYAISLGTYKVDYDVFASSYYPYWHGSLDNLREVLNKVNVLSGKKTMIAETSYCYSGDDFDFGGNTISGESKDTRPYPFTIAGQANHVRNVAETVVKTNNCIGMFYWEGAWIPCGTSSYEANKVMWDQYGCGWASSYASDYDPDVTAFGGGGTVVDNQTFFDKNGHALESLKVWALLNKGNDAPLYVDGVENVTMEVLTTQPEITFPEKVNVVMNDNSKVAKTVVWDIDDSDIEAIRTGGNKQYVFEGTVDGYDGKVTCTVNAQTENLLKNHNYSFENSSNDPWVLTKASNDFDASITKEGGVNPRTGSKTVHFWGANANKVNFTCEMDATSLNLASGSYDFSISLLGGVTGDVVDASKQNIYVYAKVNGVEYKQTMNFRYYSDGHVLFTIKDIPYTAGQTIILGFHCEANQAGSWGDFDDAMLNYNG